MEVPCKEMKLLNRCYHLYIRCPKTKAHELALVRILHLRAHGIVYAMATESVDTSRHTCMRMQMVIYERLRIVL